MNNASIGFRRASRISKMRAHSLILGWGGQRHFINCIAMQVFTKSVYMILRIPLLCQLIYATIQLVDFKE